MEGIHIQTDAGGIRAIVLPQLTERAYPSESYLNCLKVLVSGLHPSGEGLAEEVREYLEGKRICFTEYPLAWEKVGPMQKRVFHALCQIPYGETITYSQLADRIGCIRGARAVGQALKRNPWPILVPCHRVIKQDSGLGGFSSGLGWKRLLLSIEGYRGI